MIRDIPILVRALIRLWEKQARISHDICMHVWDSPYDYTGFPYVYRRNTYMGRNIGIVSTFIYGAQNNRSFACWHAGYVGCYPIIANPNYI